MSGAIALVLSVVIAGGAARAVAQGGVGVGATGSAATGLAATGEARQVERLPVFPEFRNPLTLVDPATGPGVSCPDPAIVKTKAL